MINKKIRKERWTEYRGEDIRHYDMLRNLEKEELFGKKDYYYSTSAKTLNHNGSVLSFSPSNVNILSNHNDIGLEKKIF